MRGPQVKMELPMNLELSRMTHEERIRYHMERIEREESLLKVQRKFRTKQPLSELKSDIQGVREDIQLLSNVLFFIESDNYRSHVNHLNGLLSDLTEVQKHKAMLLRRRMQGHHDPSYSTVKTEYDKLLLDAAKSARLIDKVLTIMGLSSSIFIEPLKKFKGFDEIFVTVCNVDSTDSPEYPS
jgi:hypothetical protein